MLSRLSLSGIASVLAVVLGVDVGVVVCVVCLFDCCLVCWFCCCGVCVRVVSVVVLGLAVVSVGCHCS